MADYRLGLDIGSNSIGWCAVALGDGGEPIRVLGIGVRILSSVAEAGRDSQSKASLAANRREKRAARKARDRFMRRRRRLLEVLVEAGLMPESPECRKSLERLDPYCLRKAALDRRLEPWEIGRALFHIDQRRGFKSNRLVDSDNDEKSATKQGMKTLAAGISETGARTLGEFLADRHRRDKQGRRLDRAAPQPARFRPTAKGNKNLYELYPTRKMAKDEIDRIWEKQGEYHPDLLTDPLRKRIERIIVDQRPLKKQIVGRCTLRPDVAIESPYGFEIDMGERAPKAHPLFQRFRILQDVSHLRVTASEAWERPLNRAERAAAAAALTGRGGTVIQFERLRKAIRLPDGARFNYERSGRKGLKPDETSAKLASKKAFGPSWRSFGLERRIEVVERLLADDEPEALCQWLRDEFGVSAEAAEYISELRLPQGHGQFGRAILRELVDVMSTKSGEEVDPEIGEAHDRGLTYDEAVERVGRHHSDLRPQRRGGRLPYYGEILGRHVISRPDAPENSQERIGRVSNPTVHIGLNQLRKVVNALIDVYGPPVEIVVELARELKMNKEHKDRIRLQNNENERKNTEIRKTLGELGLGDNTENRLRLRLFNELPPDMKMCAYSGVPISMETLFGGAVEIDHILPVSRTLDPNFMNMVLCTRLANRSKGANAPAEAWSGDELCEIGERANRLFPRKAWRFAPGAMDRFEAEGGFAARQLTDTAYLSRLAKEYLEHVCVRVDASPGRLTAMLRAKWGLNSLLPDHNYPNVNQPKNRKDHRHHAIDAFVLACTTRSLLIRISREAGKAEKVHLDRLFPRGSFPEPFDGYRDDLAERLRETVVSYKPDHGIEGALLEATAYGLVDDEIDGKRYNLVARKPIAALTKNEIECVRDPKLRKKLQPVAKEAAKEAKDSGRKFAEALAKALAEFGATHRIRRVRVLKKENMRSIRVIEHGSEFLKAYSVGANHRIEIYELPDGTWHGEPIPRFDANTPEFEPEWRRKYPQARLVMKIHKGDTIEADFGDGRDFYVVKRLEADKPRLALHNEAGALDKRNRDNDDPFKWVRKPYSELKAAGARRVRVDPLGRAVPVTEKP